MTVREAIRNAAGLDDTSDTADVTDEHVEAFRAIDLKDGDAARAAIRAKLVELYAPDAVISGQVYAVFTALAVDRVASM